MNRGRATCEVLKGIRLQIARENCIDYQIDECKFEGNCSGTCPKCEADIRFLERELVKQNKLGKAVVIAGLSVGLLGSLFGNESENYKNLSTSIPLKVSESSLTLDSIPKKNDFQQFCNNLNDTLNKYYNEPSIVGMVSSFIFFEKIVTDLEFERDEIFNVDVNKNSFYYKKDTIKEEKLNIDLVENVQKEKEKHQLFNIQRSDLGINTKQICFFPEVMPSFPGGDSIMQLYLKENINYPEAARMIGISGTVIVGFIINVDGTLSKIKVLQGVYNDLDEEAVRVIKKSPKWNPGIQDGKPIRVYYAVPIRFTIE